MAGDWIKIQMTLPDKPEVHRMAELLDVDENLVAGAMLRWFCWLNANLSDVDSDPDSSVPIALTKRTVDRICRVDGIVDALVDAGWLEIKNDSLHVPKFGRHNGSSAKKRAQKTMRQYRWRGRKMQDDNELQDNESVDAHVDAQGSLREEKRRDNSVGRKRPSVDSVYERLEFPDALLDPGFAAEFKRWMEVRLGMKLSKDWLRLFQGQLRDQLEPLALEHGVDAAVACVRQSRISEWQGLFPEKFGRPGRGGGGSGGAAGGGGAGVSVDAVLDAEGRR